MEITVQGSRNYKDEPIKNRQLNCQTKTNLETMNSRLSNAEE